MELLGKSVRNQTIPLTSSRHVWIRWPKRIGTERGDVAAVSCQEYSLSYFAYRTPTVRLFALVYYIIEMEEMMFEIGITQVRTLAFQLAERIGLTHRFKNVMAEKDWVSGFLARNPVIFIRTSEATAAARARSFNKHAVGKFFEVLETLADQWKFPPTNICNVDETGMATVQSRPSRMLAKKRPTPGRGDNICGTWAISHR